MDEIEYIDITPQGCRTAEGAVRVSVALDAFNDATASVANLASEFIAEWELVLAHDKNAREDLEELRAAITHRRRVQEEFLRAVSGR